MIKQIGSVEIKRLRIYPQDPDDSTSPDVAVRPAIFPLMRSGDRIWWQMRGEVSVHQPPSGIKRLGDDMFAFSPGYDKATGKTVSFPSRTFDPAGIAALMTEPGMRDEDGAEQRVRIVLFEPLVAELAS